MKDGISHHDHYAARAEGFPTFFSVGIAATGDERSYASKIFATHEFGYRRLTIERPLRLSAQFTDQKVEGLRFAPKPFNAAMKSLYEQFGTTWTADTYGELKPHEADVRAAIKKDFPELKEKQIKDLLDSKLWRFQQSLMEKAQALQAAIGTEQSDDFNQLELTLKGALKTSGVKLDAKEKKQLLDAITWKNQDAEPVIKKALKTAANPLYGAFDYQGKVWNSSKTATCATMKMCRWTQALAPPS